MNFCPATLLQTRPMYRCFLGKFEKLFGLQLYQKRDCCRCHLFVDHLQTAASNEGQTLDFLTIFIVH